ncbi:heme ABC transporter ATP-binding protein [Pontibaca methylaminivorans]|uniref:Iron complex transport system ATP-binding protein n=1 Tax=Pontibaca methylaminivorans TaxID=515897 RepID=A0A1R3X911_9RHOB|nr:heme ABC transporter ATP-binding protein [Pontibaca methylaminivorans]SIT86760.1 iron complex transport system ATP-binding protein [Pontibaca methylaminivorans]
MIEIENLGVTLGGREILQDIALTATPGEVTAIVGPNGSGKSTLIKAVCGDLPSRGRIRINGRDLHAMAPWQAAEMRAVLPQSGVLAFPYTVREVVALGLSAGRAGSAETRDLPERALRHVDLDGFGGRYYQELSGGEQQRVQLARVLCQIWRPVLEGMPRWLLLDEPVSSLDIRHQLLIMGLARDYARAGGGVIAVLHDLNLTAMFADRIAVMRQGCIAATGRPGEVMTDRILSDAYDCDLHVSVPPRPWVPFVLPQAAGPASHGPAPSAAMPDP